VRTIVRRVAGIAIGIAVSAVVGTTSAGAILQDAGGAVNVLAEPPADVSPDVLASDTQAFVFVEQACVTLTTGLAVDVINPAGTYSDVLTQRGVIPAGTQVDSYYVHFDQVQTSSGTVSGTLTFDRPVLGLIYRTPTLNSTDATMGAPGTQYPEGPDTLARGYDGPSYVSVSVDGRTVTFSAQVSAYQEELRIITTGTCEAETLADCKNGRWDAYGFRNQGQCVSFVATNSRHAEAAFS
jgi:hypothetical protein